MDMRRLSEGKIAQESPMEARLREFRAGRGDDDDATVPKAAGGVHQSMVQIPQSPIYGADGPQPKGSLPKQSASYSYTPGVAMASNSTINDDPSDIPGGLASPQAVNRSATGYKSMALASYQTQKKKAIIERNVAARGDSDSSDDASAQTDSEDEAVRRGQAGRGGGARGGGRGDTSPTKSAKSGASSARTKASSNNRSSAAASSPARNNSRQLVVPGTPDSDSSVGPTTSESEEEEMTAAEKMDM